MFQQFSTKRKYARIFNVILIFVLVLLMISCESKINKLKSLIPGYEAKQRQKEQQEIRNSLLKARNDLVGKLAPNISGYDINGNKISLNDFKGKAIILNFSATWCRYCSGLLEDLQSEQKEINDPSEYSYYKDYKDRFAIITVLTDSRSLNTDYKTSYSHYKFPVIAANRKDAENYRIYGFPTTFLIGADGVIQGTLDQKDGNFALRLKSCWNSTCETLPYTFEYELKLNEKGYIPKTILYICSSKSYKSSFFKKVLSRRRISDKKSSEKHTYRWNGKFLRRSDKKELTKLPGDYYYYIKRENKKSKLHKFTLEEDY